jgi:hypothetical protein
MWTPWSSGQSSPGLKDVRLSAAGCAAQVSARNSRLAGVMMAVMRSGFRKLKFDMTELSINKPATSKRGLSWLEFEAKKRAAISRFQALTQVRKGVKPDPVTAGSFAMRICKMNRMKNEFRLEQNAWD